MADLTPEEIQILMKLSDKMGEDLVSLAVPKVRKKKEPPKPLFTGKYERVYNRCTLCNTEWYDYFAMRKYTDDTLRSKRVALSEIPAGATLENLTYPHHYCDKCKEILPTWTKEELINTILYDRKNRY